MTGQALKSPGSLDELEFMSVDPFTSKKVDPESDEKRPTSMLMTMRDILDGKIDNPRLKAAPSAKELKRMDNLYFNTQKASIESLFKTTDPRKKTRRFLKKR